MWQDYVLTIGLIVFNIALIPAIQSKQKPPFATAVPTAFFQLVFVGTFASLHMWFSTLGSASLAILWTVLAVQSRQQTKRKKKR